MHGLCTRYAFGRKRSQCTRSNVAAESAHTMRSFTTFFLLVIAKKLCCPYTCDNPSSQVLATVRTAIPTGFADRFPYINHAVIATVVIPASLRHRIVWTYGASSGDPSVIVIIATVVNPFSDLFLVEKVFLATRRVSVSAANNTSFVFDILFSNNLVIIVPDSFSDYDGFLSNNNGLWLGWWGTVILGTPCVSLKVPISIVEHTRG
jgi:hypothetical protein